MRPTLVTMAGNDALSRLQVLTNIVSRKIGQPVSPMEVVNAAYDFMPLFSGDEKPFWEQAAAWIEQQKKAIQEATEKIKVNLPIPDQEKTPDQGKGTIDYSQFMFPAIAIGATLLLLAAKK